MYRIILDAVESCLNNISQKPLSFCVGQMAAKTNSDKLLTKYNSALYLINSTMDNNILHSLRQKTGSYLAHILPNSGRATKTATEADIAVDTTFTISLERKPHPPTFVAVGPARFTICLASSS